MVTVNKLLSVLNDKIDYYKQYIWMPDTMRGMMLAFEHCKSYIEFLNSLDNDKPLPLTDSEKIFALKSDILFKLQYYTLHDDISAVDFGVVLGINECLSFITKN